MKGTLLWVTFSFFLLSSCETKDTTSNVPFPEDTKTLVFFSDESNIQDESSYYDALLDLKKTHPTEVSNLKVIKVTDERLLYKQFNIKSVPSLIVVEHNEVITSVEGVKNKDDIITPIQQALGNSTVVSNNEE
ncbi:MULTISPECIES: YbbN family protein [Bacillus]|uniref:hypothetical protein n=1 Tax=Bacillus TaxID=1386 RepID=UPI000BB80F31|nr:MULTISPECIES: hypothetical protein [Bacillus]